MIVTFPDQDYRAQTSYYSTNKNFQYHLHRNPPPPPPKKKKKKKENESIGLSRNYKK